MENLKIKIKEWEDWCENDIDQMNDYIRDFFYEQLEKKELFEIIEYIKNG